MVEVSTMATSLRTTLGERPWLQAVLLLAVGLAVLSPSLGAEFVWDDIQQIVDSPTISDPKAPARYLSLNVVQSYGSEGRGADGVDTYRPLFFVTLWAIHHINGPDPFWFHLAVILAHLGACLLLWLAARRWIGSALAAAAVFTIFAVHPVTAEAYLWASAISEPMAAAGLLGAALLLDRCRGGGRTEAFAAITAGLAMLLGLLSKEVVLTALPAVSLYLWRVRGVRVRALLGPWIAAAIFLGLRLHALGGLQATGNGADQRLEAVRNLPVLVLDGLRAMLTLWPVGIRNLYWDYHLIGWGASLVAAAVVGALVLVAWRARQTTPLIPTALWVTICMLAPVALVATVPGWGGFGRYLYLPLGFTVLGLAQAVLWLERLLEERYPRFRRAPRSVVAVFIAVEIVGLSHAIDVYHSQENLARGSIELAPHAPDGWEWLGNHHVEEGDLVNAARCYAEAVARAPDLYRPRHNLAAALLYLGRPGEALEHELVAESGHGPTTEGTVITVSALMELGRWDEAAERLLAGLDRDPQSRNLQRLQIRLLAEHPDPAGYRGWLEARLTTTPERPSAEFIRRQLP
jgi:hypothetical protein